jgi:hypothetical protein
MVQFAAAASIRMHRVTDGGIEHMSLLARWRSTVSNADRYQKRHEAD